MRYWYSDHIQSMLRKCNIPESDPESLAADRFSDVDRRSSVMALISSLPAGFSRQVCISYDTLTLCI